MSQVYFPQGWLGPFSVWNEETQQWVECVRCEQPLNEEPNIVIENDREGEE